MILLKWIFSFSYMLSKYSQILNCRYAHHTLDAGNNNILQYLL